MLKPARKLLPEGICDNFDGAPKSQCGSVITARRYGCQCNTLQNAMLRMERSWWSIYSIVHSIFVPIGMTQKELDHNTWDQTKFFLYPVVSVNVVPLQLNSILAKTNRNSIGTALDRPCGLFVVPVFWRVKLLCLIQLSRISATSVRWLAPLVTMSCSVLSLTS